MSYVSHLLPLQGISSDFESDEAPICGLVVMLGEDAWMGKHFIYLDVFAYIRMVLLHDVCISRFRLNWVLVVALIYLTTEISPHLRFCVVWLLTKISRRPISGVALFQYSSEPSRLYSKSTLQCVSVFPVVWNKL